KLFEHPIDTDWDTKLGKLRVLEGAARCRHGYCSVSVAEVKEGSGRCVCGRETGPCDGGKTQEKSLKKRHSVLLHALTWKRLVAASAKKKNAKKVNPKPDGSQAKSDPLVDQLNTDNIKKSQPSNGILDRKPTGPKPGPIPVPVPTVPDQTRRQTQNGRLFISPRRVVVQASTGELLRCLSDFLCRRCFKLKELTANEVILWFRNVDRALLVQGWQDQGFITPANLVFVYLLCREAVEEDTVSEYELQATFLTCLYLAYS
ncbi:cyclin-dependent kinase 5 activator 2-like, partial [Oncorhynchus kisutch]